MKQHPPARIDMARRYTLSEDARVIPRSATTVQIGTDEPRRVMVIDAPSETCDILGALNGANTVAQVLIAHDADPLLWSSLLEQLLAIDLLLAVDQLDRTHITAVPGGHLTEERSDLAHRHGQASTARILQARDDALVVVRGDTSMMTTVAGLLAASGVGHIHHENRWPQPWTVPAPSGNTATHDSTSSRSMAPPSMTPLSSAAVTSASLRATYPTVRVHPPAAHQRPTIIVLAGDPVPDLGLAASLVRAGVPHLAVSAGIARSVVGPLVLPGRSSCLSCAHRHRTDADPGWPAVARQLTDRRHRASAVLVSVAACLAASQVLEHIDGIATPTTIDGTLEWRSGDAVPRRRTWPAHPECGCRGAIGVL